jgi:hypothetical protein
MGFLFGNLAGILMSVVMLCGKIFGRLAALAGIIGFALLLAYLVISVFIQGASGPATVIVMAGGLCSLAWYVLVAVGLIRLSGRKSAA